jgi:hypothetical protein
VHEGRNLVQVVIGGEVRRNVHISRLAGRTPAAIADAPASPPPVLRRSGHDRPQHG